MATLEEILPELRQRKSILVTGPQRSGTTIAARIIAAELGCRYADEDEVNIDDTERARELLEDGNIVLQAPGLCHVAETLGCTVVIMIRPVKEIEASQKRIGWLYEEYESNKYGAEGSQAMAKYKRWQEQRLRCDSFELEYESLKSHPLWVDKGDRLNFDARQWRRKHE